jgi:hypothetical protein
MKRYVLAHTFYNLSSHLHLLYIYIYIKSNDSENYPIHRSDNIPKEIQEESISKISQ